MVGIDKGELQEGASLRDREERVSKRYDDEQRVVWAGTSSLTSSPAPLTMTCTTRAPHGSSVGGCDMAAAAGGANVGLRSSAPPLGSRAPRWGVATPPRGEPARISGRAARCRSEAARVCRCSCPRWSSSPRVRPPYSARYITPSREEEPSANETNHPTQRRSHHLICHHRCAWGSIASASDPALRDALTMRCDPFRSRP